MGRNGKLQNPASSRTSRFSNIAPPAAIIPKPFSPNKLVLVFGFVATSIGFRLSDIFLTSPFFMAVLILLTIVALAIVQIAAANPLKPTYQPKKFNLSSSAQCVHSPLWVGKGILYRDCMEALAFFDRHEANKNPYQLYEFLTRGTKEHYDYPAIPSPSKYVYGTCAIVITTLSSFPAAILPPGAAELVPYPPSDVETFAFFRDSLVDITSACIRYHLGLSGGWLPAGRKNQALGIFIWSTSSFMNRFIY